MTKNSDHKLSASKQPRADYIDWRSDCQPDVLAFLHYLGTIRNRSSRTVSAYYVDIRSFLRFLKLTHGLAEGVPFSEIRVADTPRSLVTGVTLTEAIEFLSYMQQEHGNSATTRARKISALRTFYRYLVTQTRLIEVNPLKDLELPKKPKTLPKYLTLEESKSLLSVGEGVYAERDRCIFTLFLNCGIRLSELVGMNLADIRGNMVTITGKGDKQRTAYLNAACLDALAAYLPIRASIPDAKDQKALFLSHTKSRITARGVQSIMQRSLVKLGLQDKGYTVHKLRHTAATLMYQYGHVDIRVLQLLLGHENLGTTEIYTHVADQQVRDASNANPLADFSPPKPRNNSSSDKNK